MTTSTLRTRAIGMGNLRAFLSVAQHLNFRAAADELALTQSAVSRQIQALESEVGIPLFLRHTRAVELTNAGLQLLRTVEPALAGIDSTSWTWKPRIWTWCCATHRPPMWMPTHSAYLVNN